MGEYDLAVEEAEGIAERAIDEVVDRGEKKGVAVEGHLRRGLPSDEILDAIDDYGIDLVVMGTHGRTGVDRIVHLGSVTERVVRRSPVQVLAIPFGRGAPDTCG